MITVFKSFCISIYVYMFIIQAGITKVKCEKKLNVGSIQDIGCFCSSITIVVERLM